MKRPLIGSELSSDLRMTNRQRGALESKAKRFCVQHGLPTDPGDEMPFIEWAWRVLDSYRDALRV